MEPHPHPVTEQERKDEQLVELLKLLVLVIEWPLELQVVEAQGG